VAAVFTTDQKETTMPFTFNPASGPYRVGQSIAVTFDDGGGISTDSLYLLLYDLSDVVTWAGPVTGVAGVYTFPARALPNPTMQGGATVYTAAVSTDETLGSAIDQSNPFDIIFGGSSIPTLLALDLI
jgi:hypothetical protein